MIDKIARIRLSALLWVAVSVVAGILAVGTIDTLRRIALFGARPPRPLGQTVVRIAIAVARLCS